MTFRLSFMLRLAVFVFLTHCATGWAGDISIEVLPLQRNGVELYLQCMQASGQSSARQLLMVHGLTYSSHEFDVNYGDYSLSRFFAEKGYTVWTLDIAGYGSSQELEDGFEPNSDYAAEDIAAAAALILETSGQSKLDILGWSWGTVTGSRFAAKHPEMVNKLVLYAPILSGLVEVEVTAPFNVNTWEHAAGDFQKTADGLIDHEIVEPAVEGIFLANSWRYDKTSSPNGGRRDLLVSPKTRLISLGELKMPVLMIAGNKDEYINFPLFEKLAAELPAGSKQVIVPGAAHAMMMEKPYYQPFREAVLDFLEK